MTKRLVLLLASSLCSAALSAQVQVQDLALDPTNATHGQEESISIARAAHGVNLDDGVPIGGGGDYKVVFDHGGVMFTPALGDAVEVNQNLRLTLDSVRRGGATVFAANAPARPDLSQIDASIAQYRHGAIVERFDVRADALKQSFVFDRQPAGSGDLIVRLLVETNMAAAPGEFLQGLTLRAGEVEAVHIGAVVGIDATGRKITGHMNYTGSHLELVLPHAFVTTANYPLVLDPPISSAIVNSGSVEVKHPDIAYDPGTDRYLVVWERTYSASDDDIQGQRVDSTGQLVGGLLSIDTRNSRETDPTVCAVAMSGQFVVAWERNQHAGPFTQDVVGRTVNAATGSMGSLTDLAAEFTDELNPSLGGDSSGQDNECILVFESFSQGIYSREITVSNTGTLTEVVSRRRNVGPIPVPAMFGVDHTPEISKDAGVGGSFLITWIGTDPENFIYFRFLDRNSSFLSGVGGLPGTRMRNPQVTGDGQSFVMTWEQAATSGPKQDLWGIRLAIPASSGSAPLGYSLGALVADPSVNHTEPAVGIYGDRFLVGHSRERNAPRGPYTMSGEFDTTTMTQLGGWYGLGSIASYSYNLESAIAMRTPSASVVLDGLMVFRQSIIVGGSVQSSDIRVWRHGGAASSTSYGSGCGSTSKSFYELMQGNAFDLSGSAMRLINNGSNYTAQAGGTFVAPGTGATQLTLGLDDESTVTLTGSFPYHGGTTSSLVVCSNGFVSVGTGNGTDYTPTVAEWLNSSVARWGSWHDFNVPTGGAVTFEQIGTIAYVTWDGAVSYGTTDANTWQLQFDLATGNVTYVWDAVIASGDEWLVGYASGTGDNNAGQTDISTALPGTFQTSPVNHAPVALSSTPPTLGTTCVLTTTDIPATSVLAIQALSLTAHNPGIDLAFLGMPGCSAYTNLDAVYTMVVSGGQASYGLTVPNQANLIGFELAAQSSVFAPTANAFGFVNSNGLLLSLDY